MTDGHALAAAYRWRADAEVIPLPYLKSPELGHAADFRTLSKPGVIASASALLPWSLHMGLAEEDAGSICLIAYGFSRGLAAGQQDSPIVCLAMAPNILIGACPASVSPELFSGTLQITENAGNQWIEEGDASVLLRVEAHGVARRFCLVTGRNDPTSLRATAQRYLEQDPVALWDKEWSRRSRFLGKLPASRLEFAAAACEIMHAHLRPPEGEIAHIWSAADSGSEPSFDLNQILPLVAAWSVLDSHVARQLLASAFDTQGNDGSLAAVVQPVGRALDESAPLPLLATATAYAWSADKDPALLESALPQIQAYLEWALRYFYPDGSGVPQWPQPNAFWHVGAMDARTASADATAFLVAETGTFLQLAAAAPSNVVEIARLQLEHDRLLEMTAPVPGSPWKESDLHEFVRRRVFGRTVHEDPTGAAPQQMEPADILTAALCVAHHAAPVRFEAPQAQVSATADWLEQRRRAVLTVTGGTIAILVLGLASYSVLKKSMNVQSAETTFGMAQWYYQESKYEDAIRLYHEMGETSRGSYAVEMPLGNAHFKLGQFAEAEACFRTAIQRDPASPRPAWNLALSLYRQGNLTEADRGFQSFIERFGAAYPDLATRAAKARSLIAERRTGAVKHQ